MYQKETGNKGRRNQKKLREANPVAARKPRRDQSLAVDKRKKVFAAPGRGTPAPFLSIKLQRS